MNGQSTTEINSPLSLNIAILKLKLHCDAEWSLQGKAAQFDQPIFPQANNKFNDQYESSGKAFHHSPPKYLKLNRKFRLHLAPLSSESSLSLQAMHVTPRLLEMERQLQFMMDGKQLDIMALFIECFQIQVIIINLLMDKTLLVTLLLLGAASFMLYNMDNATSKAYSFEQYKNDFQKEYRKEGEEEYRKAIFLRNLVKIEEHNANPKNTHTIGINQFTDLTDAEFQAIYLTLQVPHKNVQVVYEDMPTTLKAEVDWVAAGKVTRVKNQGSCGSCWAFSATASLESAYMLAGTSLDLSEQELVDCSRSYGNQGCNGGWMDSAFDYIRDNQIRSSAQYPYTARDGACKAGKGETTIASYVDVPGCNDLVNALAARPISVAVDASVWSGYRSGVLSSCGTNINHGVLLVGATDDYWKIKNSWGTSWGETGFIRLSRGNTCAVCSYPSYPTL